MSSLARSISVTVQYSSIHALLKGVTNNPTMEVQIPAFLRHAIECGIRITVTDCPGEPSQQLVLGNGDFALSPL